MPAVHYELNIEQGATCSVDFEWRENDGTGLPPEQWPLIPTTGYTPHMQIRTRAGGAVLATFTPANGLTATGGIVALRIGAVASKAITRSGVYDIELHHNTDPDQVVRIAEGPVVLWPEVTND